MKYSINYINTICTDLGGSGGHEYEIDGLNEICTLLSATAGHTYSIDALNAICTALGYTAGWAYNIDALNTIVVGGTYQYEYEAWADIQVGSKLNLKMSLYRNYDIVNIAGHNIGGSSTELRTANGGRFFLNEVNSTRVRSNSSISSIILETRDLTNTTEIWFHVWRKDGLTYDVVYEENIFSKVATNTNNSITLAQSVDVQEGDYLGFGAISSSNNLLWKSYATVTTNTLKYVDSSKPGNDTAFDSGTSVNYYVPIYAVGRAPMIVTIGDSIIAGHPTHYSYIEDSKTDSPLNCIAGQLRTLDENYYPQNMGIGGQNTTQIAARFATDVVALYPRIVIINGGVNDISQGTISKSTFLSNYTSILNAAVAANIIPVVCKILPWTNGTDEQMAIVDEWNADLATLVSIYTTAIFVDFDTEVGQFRGGGSAGNLWDIKTAYNADGVHLNLAGYAIMASKINSAIKRIYQFNIQKPVIRTTSSSSILDVSASINATVFSGGKSTTVTFEYGTTTSYGSTASGGTVTELSTVSANLTSLTELTTYHWRVKSENSQGITYSSDQTFTTEPTIPSILSDGNTFAHYDFTKLTTITKDGNNYVSRWNDRLGSGIDLIQTESGKKPLYQSTGILFDGSNDFMSTGAQTLNQPTCIYMVAKQKTWTQYDRFFDGTTASKGTIIQYITANGLTSYAGSYSAQNDNLALDTFAIIRCFFNGASGKLQINDTSALTGNYGSNNMGGFVLAAGGDLTSWANIEVKEIIIRKIADTSGDETAIYNYLKNKYGL